MKSRYLFVFLFFLSFAGLWLLPWWCTWCIGFLIVLILPLSRGRSFVCGFLAGFLSWLLAILYADLRNDHILSKRLAVLFHMPSFAILILVNAIVGGLLAGSGAWLASCIRNFSNNNNPADSHSDNFLSDTTDFE